MAEAAQGRASISVGWHHGAMTRDWTPLAFVYLALAMAGLIGTWWFNALAALPLRPLTSAVQDQAAQFLESGGAAIPPIAPAWAPYFEEPTASLRDDLGYIR